MTEWKELFHKLITKKVSGDEQILNRSVRLEESSCIMISRLCEDSALTMGVRSALLSLLAFIATAYSSGPEEDFFLTDFQDLVKLVPYYASSLGLPVHDEDRHVLQDQIGSSDTKTVITTSLPETTSEVEEPSTEDVIEPASEGNSTPIMEMVKTSTQPTSRSSSKETTEIKPKAQSSSFTEPLSPSILDEIKALEPDENGRKCINKTMLRRETEYEEVIRCDHTYHRRCYTTYVTNYKPFNEQECQENFRKVCEISYEQKAVKEKVEECTTPLVPDCTMADIPEVCRTVYDTVCHTRQEGTEVEEQFPVCTTVNMTQCEDVTLGLTTEQECEVWPVQQCEVEDRKVTHTQPRTECRKEPRELCAPGDCPLVEVVNLANLVNLGNLIADLVKLVNLANLVNFAQTVFFFYEIHSLSLFV